MFLFLIIFPGMARRRLPTLC